ncbi:TRAP transporter small permease [Salinarimonas soli]|uniref:TRAP transporter small permease protein n=1 Tax=Salinarimonas soli TaxID=1638099 RepID=A0A5B2VCH6_9HYPH|nr:TRAP transporter small permease [Salinarimonas soli]KAA2236150.1 TRAP transporter small permease [Salinarimonas soli]
MDSTPREGPLARLSGALALAGGGLVVALAIVVTGSVLKRWATNEGLNGDFELVQTGLALAVFAFLPYCQARRGNIMVDTFTGRLPLPVQRAIDGVWDVVFAGVAGLVAWRLALGAMDAFSSNTTSMVLALPIGYAIAACAAMAGLLTVICIATAFDRFRSPR